MTILLIHQHFCLPTEGGGIRSYHVANALSKAGHQVHVLSGNSHANFNSHIEGFHLTSLGVSYSNSFSFLRRSFAFVKFISKAFFAARKLPKVDLVYAISTPLSVGYLGLILKNKLSAKFLFEVGDLWPDAPIQIGALRNPIFIYWLRNIEKRIYKNADCIVALSPDIENSIRQKCPTAKTVSIPNMADVCFFESSKKLPSSQFTIGYFGSMGLANHLDYLLDAAAATKKENLPISYIIMGGGSQFDFIRKTILEKSLDNIRLFPWANKEVVGKEMSKCDAIYVSFLDIPILAKGSPNKFFDGLAAGKIIITNFAGWTAELIDQYKIGFSYPPHRPDIFVAHIIKYLENPELFTETSKNAFLLASSKFELRKLLKQIVEEVEKI